MTRQEAADDFGDPQWIAEVAGPQHAAAVRQHAGVGLVGQLDAATDDEWWPVPERVSAVQL